MGETDVTAQALRLRRANSQKTREHVRKGRRAPPRQSCSQPLGVIVPRPLQRPLGSIRNRGVCLAVQLDHPEGSDKRRRDAAGSGRPLHRSVIHLGIERREASRLFDLGRPHFSDRTAIEIEPLTSRAGGGR